MSEFSVWPTGGASRRRFVGSACAAWSWLLSRGVMGTPSGGAESPARSPGAKARSVILIFNCGGPSHIDLWDPKPAAPDNIRGEFQPIDTNVPGIQVTELLPQLA
jgi:hypothetical protein